MIMNMLRYSLFAIAALGSDQSASALASRASRLSAARSAVSSRSADLLRAFASYAEQGWRRCLAF